MTVGAMLNMKAKYIWFICGKEKIMTRQEFDSKSFEELMEMLNEESDDITTIDVLKDFIKEKNR